MIKTSRKLSSAVLEPWLPLIIRNSSCTRWDMGYRKL
jgi:hypothetical protein